MLIARLVQTSTWISKPMFKSEIRESVINRLLEKVASKNYGKYLSRVMLSRVRGFTKQTVSYDFPVTALIGPNGGGKTTILGAAACAYKGIKPRIYFSKSGRFDNSMSDWRIEYELIDRNISPKEIIRRTASFHSSKWSRDALQREVAVFGVFRTVPANERKELVKCASVEFSVPESRITDIEMPVAVAVEKILGKDISGYSHIQVDSKGRITLLTGKTQGGVQYSEFHFGAGESSVIRMVIKIETLPENSLILIEEIENGLHPVATVRMVEYLIDVAERKKIQAIFTTHSNDALLPLPSKAIWAAVGSKVFQGKLDIQALRAITSQIDARLAIFTEDAFSRAWVEAMLRSKRNIPVDLIEIHSMEGDGMAVEINKFHNMDPTKRFQSVCFIDGDSRQMESSIENVHRLPGESPEAYIFDKVLECLEEVAAILAVSLHLGYDDHHRVAEAVTNIRKTNRDPHLLYSQVGQALGLITEATVRGAFLSVWSRAYPDEVSRILEPVLPLLPTETQC